MAEIISTELKVYAGTTTNGQQIGSTITDSTSGGPATVNLNLSTLGADLQPGQQYCVIARCSNNESFTTEWTSPYAFKTLILAEIVSISGGNASISPKLSFTYDKLVLTNAECGVYLSTNASGTSAVKHTAPGEQEAGKGWTISGLNENTTYYAVPYVIDDLGREYRGDWADAQSANTGYANPTVTISNVATTYNSITGNVSITSNDTISSVVLRIEPTGGGEPQYKTLTAETGTQTWSVTDKDLDDSSNPIDIKPSTEYRIQITATGSHSESKMAQATATTAAQSTATIAITGIDQITPNSARVLLSYGSAQNQTPGEQNQTPGE